MTADDGDDDGLKPLRAVWLSMPDEDPPDRGLDALMAAARVKANEMTTASAESSWWHRIAALLRRPPVLALATVTILLGGAALIGRRSEKVAVEPTVSSTITKPEAPAPAAELAGSGAPAPVAEMAGSGAPAPAAEPELQAEAPAEIAAVPPAKEAVAPPARRTKGGRAARDTGTIEIEDKPQATNDAAGGELAKADRPEKAAKVPQVALGTTSAMTPSAVALHREARDAVARGDCEASRRAIRKIATVDARYYQLKVASDPALKNCVPR